MQRRAPTINDVAERADTSAATVSRYFTDPKKVAAKTAQKIEAAAEALNYIRNRSAAATRNRKTNTIGMVVPTLENSIFAELIEHLTQQLRRHNQTMLISSNLYDKSNELDAVTNFAEHGVDGVILIGIDHSKNAMSVLSSRAIPTLCVWNHSYEAEGVDTIGINNAEIGRAAANHIIKLGHRDVACIFGNSEANDRAADRRVGILSELADHGIYPKPSWQCQSSYELRIARTIATNLLSKPDRPSAIICGNDVIAFATIWAAQAMGLNVPDDISVMGIGDFQGAADMYPPLSTLRIPARMIGKLASDRILGMINDPETSPPQQLKVGFELKDRQSTKAVTS